jgi:hypothetical protein
MQSTMLQQHRWSTRECGRLHVQFCCLQRRMSVGSLTQLLLLARVWEVLSFHSSSIPADIEGSVGSSRHVGVE